MESRTAVRGASAAAESSSELQAAASCKQQQPLNLCRPPRATQRMLERNAQYVVKDEAAAAKLPAGGVVKSKTT